jgi:hypothetical protein
MKTGTVLSAAAIALSSGMAMAEFDAAYSFADSELRGAAIKIVWASDGSYTDSDTGDTVNYSAGDLIGTYSAGLLAYDYVNGTDGSDDNGNGQFESGQFSTFCIELQGIRSGPYTYNVDDISNGPNPEPDGTPTNDPYVSGPAYDAADQAEVEAVIAAAVSLGWINKDLSKAGATTDQLAAIQGLIWSRLFDDTVVTGNLNPVRDAMEDLEAEIALDPNATMPNLRAMLNADTQDQLYIIPLPTAVFAGLLTLGGMGGYSRMRRR